jgi:hypothetical protein
VIRHAWPADCAKENRVVLRNPVEAIRRHHPVVLRVILTAPVKIVPAESETVPLADRIKDTPAFGHDFLADPVARDHGYTISRHLISFQPMRRADLQTGDPELMSRAAFSSTL